MIIEITLETKKREEFIDITAKVMDEIRTHKIKSGVCLIYTPHTTAAITINENTDPDVHTDVIRGLRIISPQDKAYLHIEGNSDAHIKSSIVGCSESIIIDDWSVILGSWQAIYFCEFDGPRKRKVWLKVIEG